MISLRVNNLGKAFRAYSSEWKRFARWFGIPAGKVEEHWVLKNIDFTIHQGESVGIVGQNGAGKSTLLKMITGTLQPTEGDVEINGRVAAILELGMGFNPELTGRQNVVHAAGLMGFNSDEIQQVIPRIENFAEISTYFDEPVRTYSSGMQMRVAFAVATAYRPEILIVDEALSVGDTYFQHKCFARIREFQEAGTTLLIVSHDKGAIQGLCDRAILLSNGDVTKDGPPEEVFDFYNAIIAEKENKTVESERLNENSVRTVSGTKDAIVSSIGLYNKSQQLVEVVGVGESVELRVKISVCHDIDVLVFGYGIKDRLGQVMYGTNTWHTNQPLKNLKAGSVYEFIMSFPIYLGEGGYSVQTAITDADTHLNNNYEWKDMALVFDVVNTDKVYFNGCVWSEPDIAIKEIIV